MPALSPYDEKALLRALAAGDRAAFTDLYVRWLDALGRYAFWFTGSRDLAEEIVQDVFLKIWEKREGLGEIDSFKAYVFRAAKNRLINHLRHEQVRLRVTDRLGEAAARAVNGEDTELQVAFRRTGVLLREAIAQLSKRKREVFLLSTEEGLSLAAIADRLGISKNVVKNHLYEAYAAVRQYLTTHGELSAYLLLVLTLMQN